MKGPVKNPYWYHAKVLVIVFGFSLLILNACAKAGSGGSTSAETAIADESGMEKITPATPESLEASRQIAQLGLVTPQASQAELQQILNQHPEVDPQQIIPGNLLARALAYYSQNKAKINNGDYLTIVDFSKASTEKRLFVIRMQDGVVFSFQVAHGSGSDPGQTGMASVFGNISGSNMSSLGFYLTADSVQDSHGLSLKLDGLNSSDSNARLRGLTFYGAEYVGDDGGQPGFSWGGFAVSLAARDQLIQLLKGRSLVYAGLSSAYPALTRTNSATPSPTPAPPVPTPSPTPVPVPTPSTGTHVIEFAPLWEVSRKTDGRNWTLFSFDVIQADGSNLLAGTNDMGNFCPNYSNLTANQKLNFWVYLVSAVVKYESGFNPASRYHESTMGTDSVTGQPVYSEGLMQLSYQDVQGYPFCEMNWKVDKNLSPTDPKKTILDPYINLRCGIRILNKLVGLHHLIAYNSGNYWSTLMPKNSTEQSIQKLVNQIPFCQK